MTFNFSIENVNSQTSHTVFEPYVPVVGDFSSTDSLFVGNILQIPSVVGHQFVKVQDILPLQNEGYISWIIDFNEVQDTFNVFAQMVNYSSDSSYVWSGFEQDNEGNMTVIHRPEGKSGFVEIDTFNYDIFSVNDSISIMVRNMLDTGYVCGDTAYSISLGDCEGSDCAAMINVLVLLPQDAQDWFASTTAGVSAIANMIEKTNVAFERSNISHRLRYTVANFPYNYQKQNIQSEIKDLADNNSTASTLRIAHEADIVVVLIDHVFAQNGIKGASASLDPDYDNAFAMLQLDVALGKSNVFVHEVGHLFGARHQHITPHDFDDCPAAWEITPKFITIMHGEDLSFFPVRVLNFSDPDVLLFGASTGNEGTPGSNQDLSARNAPRIRETGCEVASFEGNTDMVVMISGDTRLCVNPQSYEAEVMVPIAGNPGQPPYTYSWRWNKTGIFNSTYPNASLVSNSSSNTIQVPPPNLGPCSYFFLQVEATAADGTKSSAVKRILTSCTACSISIPN